jgi:hypothetical protein
VHRFWYVAVLLAACALALSACGGSGATGGTSAQQNSAKAVLARLALATARCVRAHGVPDFPDPNSHGLLTLARKGPLAKEENTVMGICAHLLSHPRAPLMIVGRVSPGALLRFSDCMRANGLPGYPDLGSGMKVATYATYIRGRLPEVRRATLACSGLLPHATIP